MRWRKKQIKPHIYVLITIKERGIKAKDLSERNFKIGIRVNYDLTIHTLSLLLFNFNFISTFEFYVHGLRQFTYFYDIVYVVSILTLQLFLNVLIAV